MLFFKEQHIVKYLNVVVNMHRYIIMKTGRPEQLITKLQPLMSYNAWKEKSYL
jgi:hypothetical protein